MSLPASPASQLPLDFSIRHEFSLANFVVPENGQALVNALQNIDASTEQFYFIWGERGVGKSHLLQSVCHHRDNGAYVPLSKFSRYPPDILEGLDALELVCLDDIDAVLGNPLWEERLFEFFNRIREQGNKLLVSAGLPPRGLPTALPDLASRLSWGVVYQLAELDDGGKAEALRARAHGRGFELGDEILSYILLRSSRSMASLFAVLDRLDHLSLREKRKITIPFIRNIMGW